jgi:hypothetical protein
MKDEPLDASLDVLVGNIEGSFLLRVDTIYFGNSRTYSSNVGIRF